MKQLIAYSRRSKFAGVFPTGRFAHLVEASIKPDRAKEAWNAYVRELGSVTPEFGEARLFPLIAYNLAQNGDPEFDRSDLLSKETRRAKFRDTMLFADVESLCRDLSKNGITPIFLKGLALEYSVYPEAFLRPTVDLDLYVRQGQTQHLYGVVTSAGWQEYFSEKKSMLLKDEYWKANKFNFHRGKNIDLDVHTLPRNILWARPELLSEFERNLCEVRASPALSFYIPAKWWLLFEAIEHGLVRNEVAPIRWVVDAARLIESVPSHERRALFENLMRIAKETSSTALICLGLHHIEAAGVELPKRISQLAKDHRADSLEAMEIRQRLEDPSVLIGAITISVTGYLLRTRHWSFVQRVVNLPRFLLRVNEFESVSHAVRYEVKRFSAFMKGILRL